MLSRFTPPIRITSRSEPQVFAKNQQTDNFLIHGAVFSRMSILKAAHYVQKHCGFCIPIRSKTALDSVQATLV